MDKRQFIKREMNIDAQTKLSLHDKKIPIIVARGWPVEHETREIVLGFCYCIFVIFK
jgi:hypothetical protein